MVIAGVFSFVGWVVVALVGLGVILGLLVGRRR